MRRAFVKSSRRWLILAVALASAAAGGCGSASTAGSSARPATARASDPATGAASTPATAGQRGAPRLVYFKRVAGVDPLASQLTVDADGRGVAVITLGGLSGEKKHSFVMAPSRLRRLRALIANTRMRDTACCDPRFYVYWITARNHAWRLQQRSVTPAMRPLVHELDAIIDAHTDY